MRAWVRTIVSAWLAAACLVAGKSQAAPNGWNYSDFLVSSYIGGRIAVYNSNLAFRHYMATGIGFVTGIDFTSTGNLVTVSNGNTSSDNDTVRIFAPTGDLLGSFSLQLGTCGDLKVGPGDKIYIASQVTGVGGVVREFTTAGVSLRTFTNAGNQALAILPSGEMWAGFGNNGPINVYSLTSGAQTGSITLDHAQASTNSMHYSAASNTVLIADRAGDRLFERTTNGTYVRQFETVQARGDAPSGIVRGLDGDVYATAYQSASLLHWEPFASLVGVVDASTDAIGPFGIVQAVPEPAAMGVLGLAFVFSRRGVRRSATRIS